RALYVTGVQTCALPISVQAARAAMAERIDPVQDLVEELIAVHRHDHLVDLIRVLETLQHVEYLQKLPIGARLVALEQLQQRGVEIGRARVGKGGGCREW